MPYWLLFVVTTYVQSDWVYFIKNCTAGGIFVSSFVIFLYRGATYATLS